MRAAPALNITVVRAGAWRLIVATGVAASSAALAGWIAERLAASSTLTAGAVTAAAVSAFVIASRVSRLAPLGLRFDGERWHVVAAGSASLGWQGQLVVVLDLGAWLLLRFDRESPAPKGRPPRWLALERRALTVHWHALRCALYSPRPGEDSDTPADRPA